MDDKVVGIDRQPIKENGAVNHGVVTLLERLLSEARAGRVEGIAVCYQVPSGEDTIYQSDWSGSQITLLGALTRCTYALNRTLDQHDSGRIGTS